MKISNFELENTGRTTQTDASDISPEAWLFGGKKKGLRWWALLLLLSMVVLIPLEVVLEAGINESKRCGPQRKRNSTGVCASAAHKGRNMETSDFMVRVINTDWLDKEWDFVPVGAAKQPNVGEVRVSSGSGTRSGKVVVQDCKVKHGACGSSAECGTLTTSNGGQFRKIVSNWSHVPAGRYKRGDFTWDGEVATVFMFYEDGSVQEASAEKVNRSRIFVRGIEMILNEKERKTALKTKSSTIAIVPSRSRTYSIECVTDGLPVADLARAISLYRTSTMEQPGLKHTEIQNEISNWNPLSISDVAKAAYSIKAIRWTDSCEGDVDVFTTCGSFDLVYVLPFGAFSVLIVLVWLGTHFSLGNVLKRAPHDAQSWRRIAHFLARKRRESHSNNENMESTYDPVYFEEEKISVDRFWEVA